MSYILINTTNSNEFKEFIAHLSKVNEPTKITFDLETDGLDPYINNILLMQVGLPSTNKVFIFNIFEMPKSEFVYLIQLLAGNKNLTFVGHNIKFDAKFITAKTGEKLYRLIDTMLYEVLINQGIGKKFYSLKEITLKYLNIELNKEIRESFYNSFTGDFTDEQLTYAAEDVQLLFSILEQQEDILEKQHQTNVALLENAVIPAVVEMELEGIDLDSYAWTKLEESAVAQAEEIEHLLKDYIISHLDLTIYKSTLELLDAVGVPVKTKRDRTLYASLGVEWSTAKVKSLINLSSPLQTVKILNLLGIKTESSSEKNLVDFKDNEFVSMVFRYREQRKKATSFGKEFLEKLHPITGRLHTSMNQLGTDSGRFASSGPNLMQIPSDKAYRDCFIPGKGYKFIDFDYSGQELRVGAWIFKEPKLIKAFQEDTDVHTLTATLLYDIIAEDVTREQRDRAKTFNFGVMYGLSEWGLHRNFGFTEQEANTLLRKFKDGYSNLFKNMDLFASYVLKKWFSITPLGRKRFFEEKHFFISSSVERGYRGSVIREGCNHAVQGGAADITKTAIKYIYHENPFGNKLKIILSIHDEVLVKVTEDITAPAAKFVQECMLRAEQEFLGDVPAKVTPVDYLEAISDVWKH